MRTLLSRFRFAPFTKATDTSGDLGTSAELAKEVFGETGLEEGVLVPIGEDWEAVGETMAR